MAPEFLVGEAEEGARLDSALAALAGVPRARVQRWIEAERVRVNERAARASQHVSLGDRIWADPPEPLAATPAPEPIPLRVLYEDEAIVVIDKPAGLVVHPAPGHASGTLVNALLHRVQGLAGIGGVLRPGIVHRLDQGTSGVMVVAKRDSAHVALARQFHDHTIERVYVAFARGAPSQDSGRIDAPIGRHPKDRKRMAIAKSGRAARTNWRVLRRYPRGGAVKLELRPETGRTHQLRVHLASRGMPFLGDPVYGEKRGPFAALGRPALHAAVLGFAHPASGAALRFEAELPEDLAALEASLARGSPARG